MFLSHEHTFSDNAQAHQQLLQNFREGGQESTQETGSWMQMNAPHTISPFQQATLSPDLTICSNFYPTRVLRKT